MRMRERERGRDIVLKACPLRPQSPEPLIAHAPQRHGPKFFLTQALVYVISSSSSASCQHSSFPRVAFQPLLSYTCRHRVTDDLLFSFISLGQLVVKLLT